MTTSTADAMIHRIMRPRFLAAVTAAALAIAALTAAIVASAAAPVKVSASDVTSVALQEATDNGDGAPSLIEHVEATRAAANSAVGDAIIPASQGGGNDSFLVIVHGHFTVSHSQGISGSSAPTGSVMTLVVDANSGQVTDFGVSNDDPNVSGLGAATVDRATATSAR